MGMYFIYGVYCVCPIMRRFIRARRNDQYTLILRRVYGVLYIHVCAVFLSISEGCRKKSMVYIKLRVLLGWSRNRELHGADISVVDY